MVYKTNAIESMNARLRKIIKTRGPFQSNDAATKFSWLAQRNITADWAVQRRIRLPTRMLSGLCISAEQPNPCLSAIQSGQCLDSVRGHRHSRLRIDCYGALQGSDGLGWTRTC